MLINRALQCRVLLQSSEGWISGGYFVLNRKAIDYIEGDEVIWERDPAESGRRAHRRNGRQLTMCLVELKQVGNINVRARRRL